MKRKIGMRREREFCGLVWEIWRGMNGRWYGECAARQGLMVDAPTLKVALFDIRNGFYVKCASAGLGPIHGEARQSQAAAILRGMPR